MNEAIETPPAKTPFWKISKREVRLLFYFNIICAIVLPILWFPGIYPNWLGVQTWGILPALSYLYDASIMGTAIFALTSSILFIIIIVRKVIGHESHKTLQNLKLSLLFTASMLLTMGLIMVLNYIINIHYPLVFKIDVRGTCDQC